MKNAIYADNAATSRLSDRALEIMIKYMTDDYGNPSQPYSFSRNTKKAIKESREIIASYIGANSDEIYFTSGGSESDNWAIKGFGNRIQKRIIITSCIEHHAILNACESEAIAGTEVIYLPVNGLGIIDLRILETELIKQKGNSILVSVMMANNELGVIEPIKEVAELCHKYGAYLHTDAVQAVGHINIDVNDLGIDMLSASAHKFNGPRGIGFLYIRKGIEVRSLIDGGAQEYGRRAGTENVAAIVGMACALEDSIKDIKFNTSYLLHLESVFLNSLDEYNINYIRNGVVQNHLPGLINISIKNANGEMLLHRLDLMGIYISTGSACDSVNNQVSHVIKAIGVPMDYAEGTIRISFGKYNTEEEAKKIAECIVTILNT